ncbi:MAG: tetratricopeptide repeat protein, partial [Deltaproteobacteria bacterium]|nr:tetratricopeptide repeat protein [Deltaproteobacteria bacterium]
FMESGPHSWRDIVGVFVQAGRGLVHAHGAGVVHRDFKPDNVMIDGQGRVRVLDFGLALWEALDLPSTGEGTHDGESEPAERLTVTGAVLGTPAYMAPEQRRNHRVQPACDQYSFCVSLYEALAGQRPSKTDDESRRHERTMPIALRRIVERGLVADPDGRWPSMAVLVDRLESLLAVRQRRWGAVALGVGALTVATALAPAAASEQVAACRPATERAQAVWSEPRQRQLATRFEADGRSFVQQAWPGLQASVTARMAGWSTAADEACNAGRADPAASKDTSVWQRLCLDSQLRQTDALLAVLERGDRALLEHAAASFDALDDLSACSAERAGQGYAPLSHDPATLARALELEVELQAARAEGRVHQFGSGIARAQRVADDAQALHVPSLVARALRVQADLESQAGRPERAEQTLTSAIEHGHAGHDDDEVAAAWVALVSVVGVDLGRLDDAQRMFAMANGAVARAGNEAGLLSRWLQNQGAVVQAAGDPEAGVELLTRALAVVEQEYGAEHPRVADVLHDLARALRAAGKVHASVPHGRRAVAINEARYGARHPRVEGVLRSVATAHAMLGQHDVAIPMFERGLSILREALGPEHVRVAAAHHNLGMSYLHLTRVDEAARHFQRAIAIDRVVLGEDNPRRVPALYGLAMVHTTKGEQEQAEGLLREGLSVVEAAWGPDHPDLAYLISALGDLFAARGDHETALEHYTRVNTLLETTLGTEHTRLVPGYNAMGVSLLELGRPQQARPLLERALEICSRGDSDTADTAAAHLALARTLVQLDDDRPRAYALARQSRALWAEGGEPFAEQVASVDAWLGEHAPAPAMPQSATERAGSPGAAPSRRPVVLQP